MIRGLLLFLLGALVGANLTYFAMTRNADGGVSTAPTSTVKSSAALPDSSVDAPSTRKAFPPAASQPVLPPPVATIRGNPDAPQTIEGSANSVAGASAGALLLPVQGIRANQLQDTFTDARGSGRVHDAIDIMAAAGTPVLAVADGHVEKLFNSKLGGLTLYQFNPEGTRAYYYAHLQRYADGIAEQQTIRRGQLLGYVGSTGNASPEAPHLHFAIFVLGPEKQWWKGQAINPYPLLAPGR